MSLSDPSYFLLLSVVFVLFYILRKGEPRRILLLASSYFFYVQLSKIYIFLLLFVTCVTYFGAKLLRSRDDEKHGARLFWLAAAIVVTPLIVFKYLGAFPALSFQGNLSSLALPIGISFFTFAALGYLADVYLGVIEPEASPTRVALFLAFFPLVSAGPIERAGRFMPQLELDADFASDRTTTALRLMFVGLIMKVVFANTLADPINAVYSNPGAFSSIERLCAVLFYPFYVYSDFGGYSLIAIGSAKLFGLEVRANFHQPFLSATVPEFWRNWHISLSSWVRDYIFAPLSMGWRRYSKLGLAGALLISFLVIGIWHGAKWGYVVFGAMHGALVITSAFTLSRRDKFWAGAGVPAWVVRVPRVIITFFLVTLTYVVFRADTLSQAMQVYQTVFSLGPFRDLATIISNVFHHRIDAALATFGTLKGFALCSWTIPCLIVGDILARRKFVVEKIPGIVQVAGYNYGLLLILAEWLTHYGTQPFVYYKF
jgi:alginate O-acetyltransferase complex protein AlgI